MSSVPDGEAHISDTGFEGVLQAARTGADWAWKRLYEAYAPKVLGYLRSRGASDPEDLTGEVFIRVVRDLERFEGDERDFRSWIFVIAHHRLIDDRRRQTRRPDKVVPDEQLEREHADVDVAAEVLRGVSDSEVRRVLEVLTPDQRDVLLLRFLGGLKINEVARALRKRPGTVKSLQHRAVEAIRRAMEAGEVDVG